MEALMPFVNNFPALPGRESARARVPAAMIARESALDDTASSAGPNTANDGVRGQRPQGQGTAFVQAQGLIRQDSLVESFMRFKSSATPTRVMFFAGGVWNDFSSPALEVLREGIAAGKAIMDVHIWNSLYVFDFLRMVQIHAETQAQNPIAWIDASGRCFYPWRIPGGRIVRPKVEMGARIVEDGNTGEPMVEKELSPEPLEERSGESQVIPPADSLERHGWAGLQMLDEGNKFYKVVGNVFLTGMKRFEAETTITSIYKCTYAGLSASQRLRAFLAQIEMTKASRGAANVKFGWYGTSPSGVNSVISHGFAQPNNRFVNPEAQATGIYLAPQNSPLQSSLLSETDDAGEKHVILCRVIMGKTEKVDTHSPQFHPSSDEFDCGMDDLEKPRWYVVWSTHMNTHILPEYVVSFKTSYTGPPPKEAFGKGMPRKIALSFPKLFAEMGNSLPSSKIQALEILYDRFKEGKVSKDIFLRKLRTVAGDKLLTTTIKRYHNCL